MLHMQHARLDRLVMERRPDEPKLVFASEDPEHRRRLERACDSLLRDVVLRAPQAYEA
jgi:hypothetical protein